MAKKYTIYKITAPSGDCYIGYTSMTLSERWRHHKNRAFVEKYNHPFYEAIRKYGPDSFRVEVLSITSDRTQAQKTEREFIATTENAKFNLSPGGVEDASFGGKVFWERINKDKEAREIYLKKLSETKLKNDWSDYDKMVEASLEWRKKNPKLAYKLSYRNIRLANKKLAETREPKEPVIDDRSMKEKLMWKHKRAEVLRKNSFKMWKDRTEEERKAISNKMTKGRKKYFAAITDPEVRSKITEKARASIDRKKQGAAASKGVKEFWIQLKADPERYEKYMTARTNSLMKTIKRSKDENI